jgi:hypothetical protein
MQTRIRERLGIPEPSWLVSAMAPNLATTVEQRAADAVKVNVEGPEAQDYEPEQTAVERLREQIQRLKAARAVPGLSDRARVDYERVELGASRELARLEGRDVTLAQVIGSPHFAKFQADLLAALNGRPWALALCLATFDPTHAAYLEQWRTRFPVEVAAVEDAESALRSALEADRDRLPAG